MQVLQELITLDVKYVYSPRLFLSLPNILRQPRLVALGPGCNFRNLSWFKPMDYICFVSIVSHWQEILVIT